MAKVKIPAKLEGAIQDRLEQLHGSPTDHPFTWQPTTEWERGYARALEWVRDGADVDVKEARPA